MSTTLERERKFGKRVWFTFGGGGGGGGLGAAGGAFGGVGVGSEVGSEVGSGEGSEGLLGVSLRLKSRMEGFG